MRYARAVAVVAVLVSAGAQAHLMVAQRGTLNIVADGAFVVLSLPASAFAGADDDGDARLSALELQTHQALIGDAVRGGVRLFDARGPLPLDGLMLTPTDDGLQVVVLGRFVLGEPPADLRLELTLFGSGEGERSEAVTVTRADQAQLVMFDPNRTSRPLFTSSAAVFVETVKLGVEHIATGFDHLLFLLVVLAAGGGWRRVALTLTCFTVGHAVTLALSVLGGVSAPPSVVEPAIAATIIGIAAFDRVESRATWRLVLVFGCALIHGLALATSLKEHGIDRAQVVPVLVGFNLGIELGQLAVSVVAVALAGLVLRVAGAGYASRVQSLGRLTAMVVGSVWLIERLVW